MNTFSTNSRSRLDTCHPDLQLLFEVVLQKHDCSVVSGYRDKEEQNALVKAGKSQLLYPMSNHNESPSNAVDVYPYLPSTDIWADNIHFFRFAAIVFEAASELDIKVRWGGNWRTFVDLPHWEIA
jgi:peptidoglycan L-alanyl-D-glutamate endopeptidase CwlK